MINVRSTLWLSGAIFEVVRATFVVEAGVLAVIGALTANEP